MRAPAARDSPRKDLRPKRGGLEPVMRPLRQFEASCQHHAAEHFFTVQALDPADVGALGSEFSLQLGEVSEQRVRAPSVQSRRSTRLGVTRRYVVCLVIFWKR